jgi:hypothetical protein
MTIYDVDTDRLAGGSAELDRHRGPAVLVVNGPAQTEKDNPKPR